MNFQGWGCSFLEAINPLTNSDVEEAKRLIGLMTAGGDVAEGLRATEKSVLYTAVKHTAKLNVQK